MKKKYPPKPGAKRRTFFSSFKLGLQFVTDKMADAAGRDHIRTGVAATAIEHEGDVWRVTLSDGSVLSADAVIVASEAWATEKLLVQVEPKIAGLVGTIPCSSSATVILAFDEADCPFDKRWHGILTPGVEKRSLTGVSLMSSKWPERAPQGRVLLRGFLGGPRDQEVLAKSDDELIELAQTQMVDLIGVKPDARPRYAKIFRWEGGMPQYTLGHLDRVDEIERLQAGVTGLALAGNAYRGVGVPNALESGERAVTKVLGDFGITLAEDTVEEKRIY
jgi:oxygen-dependent protoporphyrinogen oxidase